MMQIKICGIRRPEDAIAAAELGADALGFIFYPTSPRYVEEEAVREALKEVPSRIVRVGVFVNQDPVKILETVAFCGLDMVQLHGDEPPDHAAVIGESILIKAFDGHSDDEIRRALLFPARAILIDARDGDRYGGTGKQSDWQAARAVSALRPLVLAGGLREDNIDEAVRQGTPAALDFNSGVESAPGIKDYRKMARLISRARELGGDERDGPCPFVKR